MLYDKYGIYQGYDEDDESLEHYGTPRHSGRYPWGSGDNPYQRNAEFLRKVAELQNERDADGKKLYTLTQIGRMMNMNSSEIRNKISLARAENWNYEFSEYKRLKDKGMSRSAIARRMGVNESTLRSWERQSTQEFMSRYEKNAKVLEDRVNEVGYVMVGAGAEYYLPNGSKGTTLDKSIKVLENKGFVVDNIQIEQLGTGNMTTVKVLAKPGTTKQDIYKNVDKIALPTDIMISDDELKKARDYVSVDPKRVMVKYAEDGTPGNTGDDKDGLIEVRRGCKDLSIGRNHYVQGRILVDGDHYLKGMITYADDLPDGIDIRFNTNKHRGTPMINREDKSNSVLKPIKKNQENIFGANIKPDDELTRAQRDYLDDDGKKKQSAINIVKEEGDVDKWDRNLAAQFASKQPPNFAKQQLKLLRDNAESDLAEINSYTNPVVKAAMLEDFAQRCERDSVHLQAAALPRQRTKFIMPLTNTKDTECYCPGFEDGEQVALVRFPHASITEIPILTVNNKNKQAQSILGDAIDAVGINKRVADRLSGADFDGDTVLVLPTDRVKIANKEQYKGLKGFSTQDAFPGYTGMKAMTSHQKGVEMGVASNLITDMTIKGATDSEMERALKYSMVVIDAEKHTLNWKEAERQLGIQALKEKYQEKDGRFSVRASTLLSRSTSDDRTVKERKLKPEYKMTDEEKERWKNGEQIWENTGKKLRDYNKTYPRRLMTKDEKKIADSGDKEAIRELHNKMWQDGRAQNVYKDATMKPIEMGYLYDPISLTSTGDAKSARPIERVYAEHMYGMQDLARRARKEARGLDKFEKDKDAAQKYKREVEQINLAIREAEKNAPLERLAQIRANIKYNKWLYDHPGEDKDHQKRQKGIELDNARRAVGAKKKTIGSEDNPLTPKMWEAIQAHAVTGNVLQKLIKNADKEVVKRYAMPKTQKGLAPAKLARAKLLLARGYDRKEVCDQLDISEKTLIDAIGLANI